MATEESTPLDKAVPNFKPSQTPHHSRILIVDDQPDNLRLLSSMLADEGYDVRRALSGTLALRTVSVNPPDLILLDINMPELSGYEVCERLKADANTRNIPIIFLSASNSEHDKVHAFEVGGVDYITKPFQVREVLARVATQLNLQHLKRLRENLSRMLVHDLRSPLSGISLSASALLRRDYLDADDHSLLQTIYATSQRLNHMLNDLLVTAKLEAGQLMLNPTVVDLPGLITASVQGLTAEAKAKEVTISTHCSPISHAVNVDENLFRRVVDNLIGNAIKFSPVGGTVQVVLESAPEESNGTTIVTVIDEGMGVPNHQRQQIFQAYETGQSIEGVSQIGLGLSFCKLVVEAHGGQITVTDNQPTGARFTVTW